MSTHNPLNEYNSYSYHHFIVIAATTERAESIANSPEDFFQFVRGGVETPGLAVLVNPMTSNKLVVQDITWTNIMNMDSGTRVQSDAVAAMTEGKMTLLEPLGVRFFNKIYDIYNGFGLSSGGMSAVWVIKTIFVGYKNTPEDGQAEYISNLKPMIIFPTEFLSEFTEAGGRYDIKFVDANAGAGFARVNNGTFLNGGSVNLGGESATTETVTLASAMQNLETYAAEDYAKNYEKMAKAQANAANPTMQQTIPTKMEFKILLAEKLKDSSFVMEVPRQQSAGGNGKVPFIGIGPSDRMDQTIERVLMMCPGVMALASKGDAAGVKWLPSITAKTETLDPAQNNGVASRTLFYVRMSKIQTIFDPKAGAEPTKDVTTPQGTTTEAAEGGDSSTSAEATSLKLSAIDISNYLEYDYTYTGKNVDVLSYDMRMNFATGFFQFLTTPSAVVKTGQVPATNNVTTGSAAGNFGKQGNVAPMPNTRVTNSSAAMNSVAPQAVATYQEIYKKWVQTETVSVNMRIRGNPLLMDGLIVTSADLDRSLLNEEKPNGLAGNWLTGPVIVKVNVRMPVEDDMNAYEPFWYDGFYRILKVNTMFSGGEFTQELNLIAMTDGSYDPVEDSTDARPKGPMPSVEDLSAFSANAEPTGDRIPIQALNISENGVKMIKTFESFAAKKYMDNTRYAIGYGHNLTDQESATGIIQLSTGPVIINNGITESQADELLRRDIKKIAETPIHNKVAVNLYQNEYDVLCSMVYNLGPGGILGSDSTLLKVLNRGQYSQVPAQIIRWNKWSRGGQMVVNSGLDRRRKLEAQHWGTA